MLRLPLFLIIRVSRYHPIEPIRIRLSTVIKSPPVLLYPHASSTLISACLLPDSLLISPVTFPVGTFCPEMRRLTPGRDSSVESLSVLKCDAVLLVYRHVVLWWNGLKFAFFGRAQGFLKTTDYISWVWFQTLSIVNSPVASRDWFHHFRIWFVEIDVTMISNTW